MSRADFVGGRLELARTFQGLTLKALAERVSASAGLLSHYENGRRKQPSPDLTAALAVALKVHGGFFYQPLTDVWRERECSFRRRVSTPEMSKKRARAHGSMIGLVLDALSSITKTPQYNVPSFSASSYGDIEAAAEACREHWKLGAGPIQHIGRVAERNGVMLVQNLWHGDKVDAFSRHGKVSVIVLNRARTSTSRWIFDVAHELGHFVLHSGTETGTKKTEEEANYFAGALLLPKQVFGREFSSRPFSWPYIFQLKKRWYVSAAAILRRAYNLGGLDGMMYRARQKQLYARGWARNEPHEPEFVGPEWLNSAVELARKMGHSSESLCASLYMTPEIFTEVTGIAVERAPFKPHLVIRQA